MGGFRLTNRLWKLIQTHWSFTHRFTNEFGCPVFPASTSNSGIIWDNVFVILIGPLRTRHGNRKGGVWITDSS
jgi:hypothetical protein